MCKKEDSSFGFAMGILAGMIGGIAAGILFAPKSGEESRKARRLMRNELTSLDRSLLFRLCEMRKEIQKPT